MNQPPQVSHRPGFAKPVVFIILALVMLAVSYFVITTLSTAKAESSEQTAPSGPPPANVILAEAVSQVSAQKTRVIGTLRAKSRSEIAAREAGPVLEVLVNEGDLVEKGQVIARLDDRRMQAQMAEGGALLTVAKSMVSQREAEFQRSATDLEMKETLFKKKALSESEVLDARRESSVASAMTDAAGDSLAAAAARVQLMTVQMDDLTIKAPFAGRIVRRHIELGEWVNPGDPIATLVSTGEIEAWLQVPERFAAAAQGTDIPITITTTGETILTKKLTPLPEANTATRTVDMIALLPDPDNALVAGLSVSASIPVTESIERLAVPVNAIVQSYSGPGVFTPEDNGQGQLPSAKRIPVKELYQENGLVFIEADGISPGTRVIVEGNERLFPGQPLLIQENADSAQAETVAH